MDSTSDQLLNVCQVAFPERAGMRIEAINPLATTHHQMTAFFLKWDAGAFPSPSQPLILRRYPSPLSWRAADLQGRAARELSTLNAIAALLPGFPVPPAYAAGQDESGEWLLMGALSGRNWWLPLGLVDFEKVLPAIIREHVRLMARLHSAEIDAAQQAGLPMITARQVIDAFREKVRRADDVDVIAALDRLADIMKGVDEREPRLIAVDAEITNVLVDRDGNVAAWVDWDDAALGDPRWDIAALVSSLRGEYNLDALAARAAADYARDSVRPLKQIGAWVALHALLRWAGSVWLRHEAKQGRTYDFPAAARFIENYDSYRAWALQALHEAEAE